MTVTHWLVADDAGVRLDDMAPTCARVISVDPVTAEESATALVSRLCDQIADPIWQLELSGFAAMYCRAEIAQAVTLTDASVRGDVVALRTKDVARIPTVLGLARALLGKHSRNREFPLQFMASLLGWVILCLLVLRHKGSKPSTRIDTKDNIFAIHGEDATRTRHAVSLAAQDPAPTILLLGRPSANIAQASHKMDPNLRLPRHTRFLRPLSIWACIKGLKSGLKQSLDGAKWLKVTGLRLGFRDRLAMTYRVMQGAAHAAWWRDHTTPARLVLFGHTGNADTSLLERAMQEAGLKTVHLVHGTGQGWAFAGMSNVALFHSGADASTASRLPAYGRCCHISMAQPKLVTGDERWLLLTSYTHPLNAEYALRGPAADIGVIEWVAQAAKALGQPPDQVLWRPHPMLVQTHADAQAALRTAVEKAGFHPWPNDMNYEKMAKFGTVITTPSTTLTDAMRLGVLPVMAATAPIQSDLIYGKYPLIARDVDQLRAALWMTKHPARRAELFAQAWRKIQPGGAMTLLAVRDAVRGPRA